MDGPRKGDMQNAKWIRYRRSVMDISEREVG